jgi:hypothetical protein
MRQDGRFTGHLLHVCESFEERNTGASSLCRGRGLPCRFRRGCEPVGHWTARFRPSIAAITAGPPLVISTVTPIESRLEGGGVNRANLKFNNLNTTTSRVSVRNRNESEREGAKQIVSK